MTTRRGWRRLAAPAGLFLGLALFGVTLLTLGGTASTDETIQLSPSHLAVVNGTASMLYPTDYLGYRPTRVEASFAFPEAGGNVSFVGCDDRVRALQGLPPERPLLAYNNVHNGTLIASRQTVGANAYFDIQSKGGYAGGNDCYTAALLFQWAAPDGDPERNRPVVEATFIDNQLDDEAGVLLLVLSVGGALLALVGGLAWARQAPHDPDDALPDSTAESLRFALDRMGGQLERTRRNLLLAGVLGIFLWYPILVPWVWSTAAGDATAPWLPWALAGAALLFLAVLTILWAREFVRLDRELARWRRRMDELRAREAGLMESLEGG